MSEKEILEQAMRKAIKNNYVPHSESFEVRYVDTSTFDITDTLAFVWLDGTGEHKFDGATSVYEVIYTHEFAKSLWGEEKGKIGYYPDGDRHGANAYEFSDFETEDAQGCHGFTGPIWKFRLMQMVISEDPIKYLGRNM